MQGERKWSRSVLGTDLEDTVDLVATASRAAQASMDIALAGFATLIGAEGDSNLPATVCMTAVMPHAT